MTYIIPNMDLAWLVDGFDPITLGQLNQRAEMLSRIDNKYVIDRWMLEKVLPALLAEFDILEIEHRRAFTYDTRYHDDLRRSAYYEHHQGLRKGFKVRVRRYADAGLCFLEVKVKGKRGMTEKHRWPYDPNKMEALTPEAFEFAQDLYPSIQQTLRLRSEARSGCAVSADHSGGQVRRGTHADLCQAALCHAKADLGRYKRCVHCRNQIGTGSRLC